MNEIDLIQIVLITFLFVPQWVLNRMRLKCCIQIVFDSTIEAKWLQREAKLIQNKRRNVVFEFSGVVYGEIGKSKTFRARLCGELLRSFHSHAWVNIQRDSFFCQKTSFPRHLFWRKHLGSRRSLGCYLPETGKLGVLHSKHYNLVVYLLKF